MKVLVYLNEVPTQYLLIEKKTTIYALKKALESLVSGEDVAIKMLVNSKNEIKVFNTNKYDNTNFESTWKHMRNPTIYLTTKKKGTNFSNLPKDVQKMVIYEMDPKEALVVCTSQIGFECDWQKLLDLNYDFVTQGFGPFTDAKEKFRYLAERVSKNINAVPEIIFVHFNGIPLGKKRFLEIRGLEDEDSPSKDQIIQDEIDERKKDMEAIFKTLSKDKSVEWVKQDDYNMWIKVKNPDNLPNEILVEKQEGHLHRKVLRDIDLYDYPETRKNEMVEGSYPGKVELYTSVMNKTDILKTIKRSLTKILQLGYGDEEEHEDEEMNFNLEDFKDEMQEYLNEGMFDDKTSEYSVYSMMQNGFTRTEAELFIKAYSRMTDDLLNNLKKMYGFDVETMM